ncbi:MAG: hypothetical protein P8N72_08920 [Flavimaricola sp.]|nr:hypothetical protein [Flavimaricola sp.]
MTAKSPWRIAFKSCIFILMAKKLTNEDFVFRAQRVHGLRYDYSLANYVDTGTLVKIICPKPEHGEFKCSPRNHLRSVNARGCPKCGRERQIEAATKPFDLFWSEAQAIHGGKYRYLAETYSGARVNMDIVCEKHGQFQQSPLSHLRGAGCPRCATEARTDKYRGQHARAAAGSIKSLSEGMVELDIHSYKGQNAEANFTCKLHDKFCRRVISALLATNPCPECARIAQHNFPQDAESLKRAILLGLGPGYTVQPFEYAGRNTEVVLHCDISEHPSFKRIVGNISRVRGCPKCGQEAASKKRQEAIRRHAKRSRVDRFEAWLAAAIETHGEKFDYSNVDYQTAREKVNILCSVHGLFSQSPADHLAGGCRKCADADLKGRYTDEFFEKHPEAGYQPALLYYLRLRFHEVGFYKVGITINDVAKRHAMLNTVPGLKFDTLAEAPMTLREAYEREQKIQLEHGDASRTELPFPKDIQRQIRVGPSECFLRPLTPEMFSKYFA